VRLIEELLERKVAAWSRNPRLTAMGIRCADHAKHLSAKSGTNSAGPGGRWSVYFACGLKATEFVVSFVMQNY
jgi:hypothetical protein